MFIFFVTVLLRDLSRENQRLSSEILSSQQQAKNATAISEQISQLVQTQSDIKIQTTQQFDTLMITLEKHHQENQALMKSFLTEVSQKYVTQHLIPKSTGQDHDKTKEQLYPGIKRVNEVSVIHDGTFSVDQTHEKIVEASEIQNEVVEQTTHNLDNIAIETEPSVSSSPDDVKPPPSDEPAAVGQTTSCTSASNATLDRISDDKISAPDSKTVVSQASDKTTADKFQVCNKIFSVNQTPDEIETVSIKSSERSTSLGSPCEIKQAASIEIPERVTGVNKILPKIETYNIETSAVKKDAKIQIPELKSTSIQTAECQMTVSHINEKEDVKIKTYERKIIVPASNQIHEKNNVVSQTPHKTVVKVQVPEVTTDVLQMVEEHTSGNQISRRTDTVQIQTIDRKQTLTTDIQAQDQRTAVSQVSDTSPSLSIKNVNTTTAINQIPVTTSSAENQLAVTRGTSSKPAFEKTIIKVNKLDQTPYVRVERIDCIVPDKTQTHHKTPPSTSQTCDSIITTNSKVHDMTVTGTIQTAARRKEKIPRKMPEGPNQASQALTAGISAASMRRAVEVEEADDGRSKRRRVVVDYRALVKDL